MSTTLRSLLFAGSIFVSVPAFAQDLRILDLTYGGSGCPQGTAATLINNAAHEFSVIFDQFIAEQPGTPRDRRKFCALRILFKVPAGFQFSIAEVQYRGFAQVPAGVAGVESSTYDFPLLTPRQMASTVVHGPFTGNYDRTDEVDLLQWSRCGVNSTLAIDAQAYLTGRRDLPAQMTVDTVDGKVTHIFHYVVRPC